VIWLKIALIAGVIAAFSYVVYAYNDAIADAATAKAETISVTKAKDAELKKIGGERDGWIEVAAERAAAALRQEEIIRAREVERARLQKERDDARTSLTALLKRPDVKPWADTELPLAVAERLRDASGGVTPASGPAATGAPAGKLGGGDGSPGLRGPNERGSAQPPR